MSSLAGRLGVFAAVLRDRQLRRAEAGYLGFVLVENSTWVAILVFAFERGGVAEAGVVAFIQLVPAALIAPLAGFAGDRYRRDRVVTLGYGAQAVAAGATAFAIAAEAPAPIVYAAAAALAGVVTFSRPGMGALLPSITETPEQLTAANVAAGIVESVGLFAGPAIAGVMLSRGGPAQVFVAAAAIATFSTLMASTVQLRERHDHDDDISIGTVGAETAAGLRFLRRHPGPLALVGLFAATSVVIGATDVVFVAVAIELLDGDGGTAGFLTAASGAGAIVGAGAAVVLIGRRRMTPAIIVGALLQSVPLGLLAVGGALPVAIALIAVTGVGVSISQIGGQTLLQGVTPDDVMARVFGLMEGMRMAALALGSIGVPVLVAVVGLRPAIVAIAFVVPAALAVRSKLVMDLDRQRPEPDPDVLDLLRSIPIFAPLPAYTLEQLTANLRRVEPSAGDRIVVEGDPGDEMYVVAEGSARVFRDALQIDTNEAGDYFGEIALLRDAPRNATVVADDGLVLYSLERDIFLEAVTGHPRSLARAHRTAARRGAGEDDVPGRVDGPPA